ncbi:hypothetical protein P1A145kb_p071 [Pectobacterium phage DU_PP_I]|nr:hypothetical protein P1A145kb_p071 [Pectobacterium phage DU_PP_I]
MEVKILVYTNPAELQTNIKKWVNEFEYSLKGPVSVGTNINGNTIYVATLTKGEA